MNQPTVEMSVRELQAPLPMITGRATDVDGSVVYSEVPPTNEHEAAEYTSQRVMEVVAAQMRERAAQRVRAWLELGEPGEDIILSAPSGPELRVSDLYWLVGRSDG